MDKISLFTKTAAEAYAAGRHDSRHFIALYKAYLRGASDAVEAYQEYEHDHSLKMAVAAMIFALLSWFITMCFVFM